METQIIMIFGRYRWRACYDSESNKWICDESIINDPQVGFSIFNAYDVFDDSIEQITADIFKSRH